MAKLWYLISKCPALVLVLVASIGYSSYAKYHQQSLYSNYLNKAHEARERLRAQTSPSPTPATDTYTDDSWAEIHEDTKSLRLGYDIHEKDYCFWADSLIALWERNEQIMGEVPEELLAHAKDKNSLTRKDLVKMGIQIQVKKPANTDGYSSFDLNDMFRVSTDKGNFICDGIPQLTITLSDTTLVKRPHFDDVDLTWRITYNGETVLERNANNEYQYRYFLDEPGEYTVCLITYVDGAYREISNKVSYTLPS